MSMTIKSLNPQPRSFDSSHKCSIFFSMEIVNFGRVAFLFDATSFNDSQGRERLWMRSPFIAFHANTYPFKKRRSNELI